MFNAIDHTKRNLSNLYKKVPILKSTQAPFNLDLVFNVML